MAESIAHFAVKSIGLSRVNGRKPCTLLEAARHNLREIQAEQGATGRIDPTRTHGNIVLHGPESATEVQALADDLLTAVGVNMDKLRCDHCQAIEAVFSLPQMTEIADPDAYFVQCLAWLRGALSLPVLSAVIHCDESAKHLHALLLPVKDGAHVGSTPIDRVALKRLREQFFSTVAGPAGLKHAGAKMRGVVKQWAIAAVLQRCEALGLPVANGPLWPVLVAAIERDPTAAMQGLGIDVNTIRPSKKTPQDKPAPNSIGIEQNPIGIEKEGGKHRTLSCVGIEHSTPSKKHPNTINSLTELWTVVGHRTQRTAPRHDRLHTARAAQQRASARHSWKSPKAAPVQTLRTDDDGWIRERDEYAHDLSTWD